MKKSVLISIIIGILIIIGLIIGTYYFVNSADYPNKIGDYELIKVRESTECDNLGEHPDTRSLGLTGETCFDALSLQYEADGEGAFVHLGQVTKGKELRDQAIEMVSTPIQVYGYELLRVEGHELYWTSNKYDIVGLQKYTKDGTSYDYEDNYLGGDPIIEYFLEKYPPI